MAGRWVTARLIADRRSDVHFLLVGKGSYERELRALATSLGLDDRFHFAGERDDVPGILALIDVFVMTSRWEAMPYSLLEAMGAGRAIVLTRIAGLEKVVENGRAGVIIPPEDPEAACREVTGLLDDAARRAALAAAARDIAARNYRLGDSIRQIEQVYSEVRHER